MFGSCLKDPFNPVVIHKLQIVNYDTNLIQFQGEQNFLYLYSEKIKQKMFIFILYSKSIGRYRYIKPILLANTTNNDT